MNDRKKISQKERIVIKVGTSSLVHEETGEIDLLRMEQLVRIICDLKNKGKEVVLVSSGAMVLDESLGLKKRPVRFR